MANLNPHRTPSVGAVVKKMLAVNPELGTQELIALVRQSISVKNASESDFTALEVVDEEKALSLARESLVTSRAAESGDQKSKVRAG